MAEQVTQAGQIPTIEKRTGAGAISPARRRQQLRRRGESIGAHVIMIIVVIICIFPLLILIETSFKPVNDTFTPQLIPAHPTLDNYKYVLTFNNNIFFTWLFNSLKIAVMTTVVGLAFSAPAAYAISRWNFLGKRGIWPLFLVTQMFPGIILLIPLYNLYAGLGLLDNIYGLVIAYATTALPFSVWMLKNFFDAVPKELDEAAHVDGLGPFRTFWRIILPLTIPGVAVVGFFNFMAAWNEFLMAFTFLQSDSNLTLPIGIQHFVFQTGADWQWLTAAAVLVTVPILVIFIWTQRYLISGLTGGSVKG